MNKCSQIFQHKGHTVKFYIHFLFHFLQNKRAACYWKNTKQSPLSWEMSSGMLRWLWAEVMLTTANTVESIWTPDCLSSSAAAAHRPTAPLRSETATWTVAHQRIVICTVAQWTLQHSSWYSQTQSVDLVKPPNALDTLVLCEQKCPCHWWHARQHREIAARQWQLSKHRQEQSTVVDSRGDEGTNKCRCWFGVQRLLYPTKLMKLVEAVCRDFQ